MLKPYDQAFLVRFGEIVPVEIVAPPAGTRVLVKFHHSGQYDHVSTRHIVTSEAQAQKRLQRRAAKDATVATAPQARITWCWHCSEVLDETTHDKCPQCGGLRCRYNVCFRGCPSSAAH